MAVTKTVWGYIEQKDMRLMRRMNRWRPPRWVRLWMLLMSRLGDGLLWYVLGIMLLCFGGLQGFHAFLAGMLAALSAIALFSKIKPLSRRKRPYQVEPHCWAFITPPDRFSFPSGHAMTSFAIAASVSHFYPELQLCLLFSAASVAASRIVLGMHFLTDVIVGAAIGAGLGFFSLWLLAVLRVAA
jgi:undecaprenyl-diphosphatase